MLILVTGATGKVGANLIARLTSDSTWGKARIRALCHNRVIKSTDRIEMARGTIADRKTVEAALDGVTHVVHLATCKETPDDVMDVAVKGLFWLLEAFRGSAAAEQFILIGGDASVGHFFYDHGEPVTEKTPHMAYPGCYALSKVLEEVMLQQFCIQYGLNGCCLRAPWIMEKDDFRYTLSFGDDAFGGPVWKTMVSPEIAEHCHRNSVVPLLQDAHSRPLKRNFVHVDDLVEAILLSLGNPVTKAQLYNICMDEPVDYALVASHLKTTRGLESIIIPSQFHSNWMDNSKAKFDLGWRPRYDTKALIDAAWAHKRPASDPRKVWYPG
jgi:UDP-glucose 4-epimerase